MLMVQGKEQWQNHEPTAFKACSRCGIHHVQYPPVARASNTAKPEVNEMRSMILSQEGAVDNGSRMDIHLPGQKGCFVN